MIDIHNHTLWGVDDGSKDKDMTLEMLYIAKKEGINTIILTPHFIPGQNKYTKEILLDKIKGLKTLSDSYGMNINILPGNEVYIDPFLDQMWEDKEYFSLANSNYVLVEFPMIGIPQYAEEALYRLQLKGLIPIIAHPERYKEVRKEPNYLYRLLEKGCLAQINTGSITGLFGEEVIETSKILLQHRMVQFIATDAHTNRKRSPKISECYKIVKELLGEEYTNILFKENPKYVIENKKIPYIEPKEYKPKKKGFLTKLKKVFQN